jgi:hypothetical protein
MHRAFGAKRSLRPRAKFVIYEHTIRGGLDAIYDHGIGWLSTAIAVSLGAPFWDLNQSSDKN